MNAHVNLEAEVADVEAAEPGRQRRFTPRQTAIAAVVLVAALGIGWKLLDRPVAEAAAMPPAVVQAAHPLLRQVTQWDDYVGRFAPSQTVEVRPRVSGAITAIHFRDGDFVHQGQPLFTVDPRPYLAALAEARADVASARSALVLARSDYARVAGLKGDEAVSAGEVDALRAKLQAASAALAAAEARVRQRALDVEFSVVRAPISGRISDRRIDIGNLVAGQGGASGGGAGATLLTTINALDPIYFTFDASEALYLKAQRDREANRAAEDVEVRLQDEADYRWKGQLSFTDNGLDPRSGTIRIRATFANPQGFLTPGMFGNMRLASGGTVKALLVPDAAVQSDQARKLVYVVGKDGMVAAKQVELGPLVEGLRVVRAGLVPGDSVVVSNFQAAAPGSKVVVQPGKIVATPTAPPAPGASAPSAAQATLAN
ncbi:MAG: efflux RND transporter periplasmic adaptor subunit [Sphingomonadales bacterium]|nr:efflux RND transporter periplasmic adaptor subunit [Sphingomonadales bacterium]